MPHLVFSVKRNAIFGDRVTLIPATLADKQNVYEWCFHSETTKSHSGPPDYPNHPISTPEDFFEGVGGYEDYYFTGSNPESGRGYLILHNGGQVGFISYTAFHLQPNMAELDIWMNSEANCGRGFGTDAILTLAGHLAKTLGKREFIMRPSLKNVRANKAYEKAGFKPSDKHPDEYLREEYISVFSDGDYGAEESALLVKVI